VQIVIFCITFNCEFEQTKSLDGLFMNKIKLLFLLLLTPIFSIAQNIEDESVCKNIYINIIQAIGNNSPVPPQFVFDIKNNGKVAFIRNNKIHFEKAAFDALSALGEKQKDGVAFILAHELAHHYLNHSWLMEAGYAYSSTEIGTLLEEEGRSVEQRKIQETQADYYAGFYAHIAGYNAFPIANQVLDIIYSSYNIDTNIKGYPSLYERKLIVNERREEHEDLILVFDAANIAFLTANYSAANSCYQYILNEKFTSREIFNNIGLSQLYESVGLLGKTDFKLYLPTKLDDQIRASESVYTNLSTKQKEEKAKELLESSLYNFNTALSLDKDYTPSWKNKVSALVLLSSIDSTYEAEMFNSINNLNNVSIDEKNNLLGIYFALTNKPSKAKKYFKKSIKGDNFLANLNIGLLQDDDAKTVAIKTEPLILNNIDLEDVVFRGSYYKFRKIPGVKLKIMKLEHSIVYDFGDGEMAQKTNNNIFESQPRISKEISINLLITKFGVPENIISTLNENYYIFDKFIVVFNSSTNQLKQIISFL